MGRWVTSDPTLRQENIYVPLNQRRCPKYLNERNTSKKVMGIKIQIIVTQCCFFLFFQKIEDYDGSHYKGQGM